MTLVSIRRRRSAFWSVCPIPHVCVCVCVCCCTGSAFLHTGFLQFLGAGVTLQLQYEGFSGCGAQAQQLWYTGLVAPQHVESSPTRDQTRVPCTGRQILSHGAPGKSSHCSYTHCILRTSIQRILGKFLISIARPQAPCKIITIFLYFVQNALRCIKPFDPPNHTTCLKKVVIILTVNKQDLRILRYLYQLKICLQSCKKKKKEY